MAHHRHGGRDDGYAEKVLAHHHNGDDRDGDCLGKEPTRSYDGDNDGSCEYVHGNPRMRKVKCYTKP